MPETTLPRDIQSIAVASDALGDYLHQRGWSDQDVDRAVLSVSEAVSNSIEHGSGEVVLRYALEAEGLIIRVTDNGMGPSRQRLEDAALPQDPFAEDGRGLFILTALADVVTVLEDGSLTVTIRSTR
ncbi:ATP-binding protein [Rubrivirga sp.]|uniref:ATP-binding protein n=1 Tax=Rubrivirga sp. TaxID=1885344 RepID=UPI003C769BEC